MVIGVPVSNVAGIGNGARHGVLLKGSEVISDFSRVDTIVFDKTGTFTVGNPKVAEKEVYEDNTGEVLVTLQVLKMNQTIRWPRQLWNILAIQNYIQLKKQML